MTHKSYEKRIRNDIFQFLKCKTNLNIIVMQRILVISLLICLYGTTAVAQLNIEDYQRADSIVKLNDLVYNSPVRPAWIDSTNVFWYKVPTREGDVYYLVDAEAATRKPAFDVGKLCERVNEQAGKCFRPDSLPLRNLRFRNERQEIEFLIDSIRWNYNIEEDQLKKKGTEPPRKRRGYWGARRNELDERIISPDSAWLAFIKNYNVYVRERESGTEYQLSFDGSEGDYYSSFFKWSPDSKKLATFKVRDNKKHIIYFVESSPDGQLQPKLHQREYLKPGDALPIRRPGLFDLESKKQVPVDGGPFEHQYAVSNLDWWEDSRAFTFEFNQRGHQVYQVVEVDAQTGQTRILVDERSSTFIDYSSKRIRHDLADGKEILWASERDGWNHLYRIDGTDGRIINQVTRGDWVVRRIVHVDEENQQIIFSGNGRNRGEDPYLIHYYRIDFSGKNLVDLTPENASHRATFSEDKQFLVDVYSRVDKAPEAVLRKSSTGEIIMHLETADVTDLLAAGWSYPEIFTAKGRDAKTDIWGNIYRPLNFDPTKKYPVIESIYAGPHGSHVPKTFSAVGRGTSGLAELGFILVRIDGMGTSNRSKAFHDVCWKNLKDAGFPDRILWMQAAARKYPYMDISRVGIYGGSAGGQNAMGALLFHPDFYDVAVASCGCHDNRMDKIWWNEQWMGYPIGPHYDSSSNVVNAHRLKGELLLLVGELDDNVDPASTIQVVDALIKADKEFELVVLPGMNHTGGGKYGERKRRDFFVRHLLGLETPAWNKPD
jgi:dipeptidyl aminopeptidase/acylaminoacyl peptidase